MTMHGKMISDFKAKGRPHSVQRHVCPAWGHLLWCVPLLCVPFRIHATCANPCGCKPVAHIPALLVYLVQGSAA